MAQYVLKCATQDLSKIASLVTVDRRERYLVTSDDGHDVCDSVVETFPEDVRHEAVDEEVGRWVDHHCELWEVAQQQDPKRQVVAVMAQSCLELLNGENLESETLCLNWTVVVVIWQRGLLLTPKIHGSNPVTGKSLFRTFSFCLKDNNNRMMGGNGPNDKTLSKILTINVSPHLCQMGCFWHQKSTVPIQSLAKSYTEHLFSVKKTIIIEWWVGMAPMTKLCRNYEQ